MENYRKIEELENLVSESKIELDLEFVIKTMKVLELAETLIDDREQRELINSYSSTLFHEVQNIIEEQELVMLEDNNYFEL